MSLGSGLKTNFEGGGGFGPKNYIFPWSRTAVVDKDTISKKITWIWKGIRTYSERGHHGVATAVVLGLYDSPA